MIAAQALIVILMGPSGSGKTALGHALAHETGLPFLEGDDFHSDRNRALMASGTPLTDADRWPWLDAMGAALNAAAMAAGGVIASCSALRRIYRDRLQAAAGQRMLFVLLDVERAVLHHRMEARQDHYMPVSLLDSQIAMLERPNADEWSVVLKADASLQILMQQAIASFSDRMPPKNTSKIQ